MNNENNTNAINATQNSNVTNGNVGTVPTPSNTPVAQTVAVPSATTPVAQNVTVPSVNVPVDANITENNNVQTNVATSTTMEGTITSTAPTTLNMPAIVNPLDVKIEELDFEPKKTVIEKNANAEQLKEKGPSEYALKLQQAIDNYKPPSKFKTVITIVMIIFIILFGTFMPEIYNYVSYLKAGGSQPAQQELTTGYLNCSLETVTSNLDKTYTRKFAYEENKLKKVNLETTTRGDITLDEDILDNLNEKCILIKNSVSNLAPYVNVNCIYTEGLLVEKESFDLKNYDIELVKAAYAEAGSTVLEFDYDSNIDDVKKSMLQAGFTCTKDEK